MTEHEQKITELENRINALVRTQIDFQKEISALRGELVRLRSAAAPVEDVKKDVSFYVPPTREPEMPTEPQPRRVPPAENWVPPPVSPLSFGYAADESASGSRVKEENAFTSKVSEYSDKARNDFERFIGENLISKIGIVVLIIGVGIGVKYSIDNDLISPLTRIIIGYIFGFGLVGLAIKLKPKYLNFSAALISGGMAIMYFVTFFGFAAYSLISQPSAFALMVLFTIFTVAAALFYNKQVIAHIGLVGAYAVPFLISSDTGNYLALFTYMAVINAGILAISVKRYWTPIFYTASALTWLIFYAWFITKYTPGDHFYLALAFLGIFATIFYATKLIHSAVHTEHDERESLVSGLFTAFVFYGFTLAISDTNGGLREFWMLFGYLAVFTAAILFSSFRFFGRPVVYLSFVFAWLTYGVWFVNRYTGEVDIVIAVVFASVFFVMFLAAVLAHRLVSGGMSIVENTGLVLTNSFLFYGFGYSIVDGNSAMRDMLGAYTAAHAVLHFAIASAISRVRKDAVDVVRVFTILILTFATIAIPVQFDGNIVTMIWAVEGALLFWFGRKKLIPLYEYFAFPVMALSVGSMFLDWGLAYSERTLAISELNRQPLANGDLVTAMVFTAAFSLIYLTDRDERFESALPAELARAFGILIAAVGVFVFYNAFRIEIGNYFHLRHVDLAVSGDAGGYMSRRDIDWFNFIWQLNYTMFFLSAMAVVNLRKIGSQLLAAANSVLGLFGLLSFATAGMAGFFELRQSYLADEGSAPFLMNVAVRYITYAFAAALVYILYRYSKSELLTEVAPRNSLRLGFEALLCLLIFITASCELLNLMAQYGIPDGSKLGLTILWGLYALALIAYGIARAKKHLRIGAIVLLGVTLVKLFFYDAADLDTIPKTILFVTLGITLLIASFLYNKYKDLIFGIAVEEADDR